MNTSAGLRGGGSDELCRCGGGLRMRWTQAFVTGELVGFAPPALTGAVLVAADAPSVVLVIALVLAGSVEGAVLGWATGRVVGTALPGVRLGQWVAATTCAAAIAWLAGMGGSALIQTAGPWALLVVVPGFAVGLLAMGVLQWWVLRNSVVGAGRWIPVTTAAWLVGVLIPVIALSLVPNEAPLALHVVVGVASAVAMGATVGLITGHTLEVLVHTSRTRQQI